MVVRPGHGLGSLRGGRTTLNSYWVPGTEARTTMHNYAQLVSLCTTGACDCLFAQPIAARAQPKQKKTHLLKWGCTVLRA
jgi:hypothetical protein